MKHAMEHVHKMKYRIARELGEACEDAHDDHELDKDDLRKIHWLCDLLKDLAAAHEEMHQFMKGMKSHKDHEYSHDGDKHYTR